MKMWLKDAMGQREHDGWGIKFNGLLLRWTVSTTREECREIVRDRIDLFGDGKHPSAPEEEQLVLFKHKIEIVKIYINVAEAI